MGRRTRIKSVKISVHPDFYKKIEKERRDFMKKHGLLTLTTKAFTGIMAIDKKKRKIKIRKKNKR